MSFRNRMSLRQQWRLLELIEANTDILSGDNNDNGPPIDDGMQSARSEFWEMVTNVLNKMGESYGKYKNKVGWRKAWRDMKSHLRGKLLLQSLRLEDAKYNPERFREQLAAASLSDLERKIFEICGLSIYEVSPKIRYPSVSKEMANRKRHMQLVQAKIAKLQRKQTQSQMRGLLKKSMSEGHSSGSLDGSMEQSDEMLMAVSPGSGSDEAQPVESNEVIDVPAAEESVFDANASQKETDGTDEKNLDTSATRRSQRENAGKRGGVRSKFVEKRVFANKRSPSMTSLKTDTKSELTTGENGICTSTPQKDQKEDKSLLVATHSIEGETIADADFHGFFNGEPNVIVDNHKKPMIENIPTQFMEDQKSTQKDLINKQPETRKRSRPVKKVLNTNLKASPMQNVNPVAKKRIRPSRKTTRNATKIHRPNEEGLNVNTNQEPSPIIKPVASITQFDVRSIDVFCRGVALQLKEMPDEKVGTLVMEIQNLIWNRKMLNEIDETEAKKQIAADGPLAQTIAEDKSEEFPTLDWPEAPIKIEILDYSNGNDEKNKQNVIISSDCLAELTAQEKNKAVQDKSTKSDSAIDKTPLVQEPHFNSFFEAAMAKKAFIEMEYDTIEPTI